MSKQPRLAAFQYRDFRLLWSGRLFSNIGSQMQFIAINWHIFDLLRGQTVTISLLGRQFDLGAEALGLGTVGLVRVIPIILFALLGGIATVLITGWIAWKYPGLRRYEGVVENQPEIGLK